MAVTLRACTVALAQSLDDLGQYVIASATGTTVTVGALVNTATGPSPTRYDGRYLHVNGQTTSESVKVQGYDPALGKFTVARAAWGTTPSAGQTIDLTGLFPMTGGVIGENTDYLALAVRSLRHLVSPDEIAITTVAGAREYSLATYAAWLTPDRVVGLLDPPRVAGGPYRPSWRTDWEIVVRGATPTLVFNGSGYPASSATFRLSVLRPPWSLVSGAESSTGPTEDTQTLNVQQEDVVTVGHWLACETLAARTAKLRPAGDWAEMAKASLERAKGLRAWDRTAEMPASTPATVAA